MLVITDADAAAPTHFQLTRQELAAFVLGTRSPSAADTLSQIDRALDRSHLMPPRRGRVRDEGNEGSRHLSLIRHSIKQKTTLALAAALRALGGHQLRAEESEARPDTTPL